MKILHLVHQYVPEKVGGTELYTQMVARRQAALGHGAAVFFPSAERATLDPTVDETGVRVYGAPVGVRSAGQVFAATLRGGQDVLAAWRQVLAAEQPDLVHVQHLMGLPPALIIELTQRAIPYVITAHDYWYGCANAQLFTNDSGQNCQGPRGFINCGRCALARAGRRELWLAPVVAPLLAWRQAVLRRVLAGAAAVITPTHFVQSMYEAMGLPTANFAYLPHGIEIPEAWRGERAHPFRVVYVGGLAPQKGVHTLIEAFNGLPPAAQLEIFGDETAFPEYVAHLRSLVAHPGVRLGGRLPHAHIWDELARATLLAIPTHWYEASSLVLDEAFAVGTPAIVSHVGVFPERVRAGVDGVLVPWGDVAAWRETLQNLYDHPAQVAQLRAGIRPPFTAEAHVNHLLQIYSQP